MKKGKQACSLIAGGLAGGLGILLAVIMIVGFVIVAINDENNEFLGNIEAILVMVALIFCPFVVTINGFMLALTKNGRLMFRVVPHVTLILECVGCTILGISSMDITKIAVVMCAFIAPAIFALIALCIPNKNQDMNATIEGN